MLAQFATRDGMLCRLFVTFRPPRNAPAFNRFDRERRLVFQELRGWLAARPAEQVTQAGLQEHLAKWPIYATVFLRGVLPPEQDDFEATLRDADETMRRSIRDEEFRAFLATRDWLSAQL